MVRKKTESPLPVNPVADLGRDEVLLPRLPLGSMQVLKRSQSGSILSIEKPAVAEASALALSYLQDVTGLNNVGTPRPSRVLVALTGENSRLYLMPVARGDEYEDDTLEVTYNRYGFRINLYKVFGHLDRFVPTGMREIYQVAKTAAPIKIEEKWGYALVIDLKKKVRLEPVHELTDQQKLDRKLRAAARASAEAK